MTYFIRRVEGQAFGRSERKYPAIIRLSTQMSSKPYNLSLEFPYDFFFLNNWINSSSMFWTEMMTWHERFRKFNYKCAHDFLIDISRIPPMPSWMKIDIKDQLDSVIIMLETQRVDSTFHIQRYLLYANIPVRLAREVMRPKQFPSCTFRQPLPLWLHDIGRNIARKTW